MTDPVQRMRQAEGLLADPLFQEAFAKVKEAFVSKLMTAKDRDEMAHYVTMMQLTEKVKGYIVAAAQTGKIKLEEIRIAEEKQQRANKKYSSTPAN